MTIRLNDKDYEVEEGISLATFIEDIGLKSQGIAIAVNYEVISKRKWEETILYDKMELMLIHAVSGG
jgi:sulfur carrier protein